MALTVACYFSVFPPSSGANALIRASSQVSSGCFAIESAAMSKLEAIFAKADRPMLLYAFF